MKRVLTFAFASMILAACSTQQLQTVQTVCNEAGLVLQAAQPFMIAASPEVKAAVALLGAGSVACGSPEAVAAMTTVMTFVNQMKAATAKPKV